MGSPDNMFEPFAWGLDNSLCTSCYLLPEHVFFRLAEYAPTTGKDILVWAKAEGRSCFAGSPQAALAAHAGLDAGMGQSCRGSRALQRTWTLVMDTILHQLVCGLVQLGFHTFQMNE